MEQDREREMGTRGMKCHEPSACLRMERWATLTFCMVSRMWQLIKGEVIDMQINSLGTKLDFLIVEGPKRALANSLRTKMAISPKKGNTQASTKKGNSRKHEKGQQTLLLKQIKTSLKKS